MRQGDSLYPSIRKLPLLGLTYSDLYRRTRIQEAVYETLTQQFELAKVQEVKETPSVKILDIAKVPERKSFPPRLLIIFLGAFLTFTWGIAWVLGEARWYAVCTFSNHERRVGEQLRERGVEHFLPLYDSVRRWKDRRVQLQLPLFPGYVFVHLALRDRLRVLNTPSVARLVGFGGPPVALPDNEREAPRSSLASQLRAEPHPYLKVGRRVRLANGPRMGLG